LQIRIAAPTTQNICAIMKDVAKKEQIDLPEQLALRIANSCQGNLRKSLLMFEACKVSQ
jgi:replication factor C subunit 3/5